MRKLAALALYAMATFTLAACSGPMADGAENALAAGEWAPETDWEEVADNLTEGQIKLIQDRWEGEGFLVTEGARNDVAKLCTYMDDGGDIRQYIADLGHVPFGDPNQEMLYQADVIDFEWIESYMWTLAAEGCPDLYIAAGGS